LKELKIAGRSQPAELVGGDLYDYFNFDEDGFGVCIGDASGHGLPAALLVRDVVTGLRMGLEKHMKMVYTFKKLNNVIYQSVYSTRFISIFYAEIEKDGIIQFVNAGHPAPILFDGNKFSELESTGLIFGALPEIQLTRGFAQITPGSVLVLYTDGIIERKSPTIEDFSIDRLKEVIKANYKKIRRRYSTKFSPHPIISVPGRNGKTMLPLWSSKGISTFNIVLLHCDHFILFKNRHGCLKIEPGTD